MIYTKSVGTNIDDLSNPEHVQRVDKSSFMRHI